MPRFENIAAHAAARTALDLARVNFEHASDDARTAAIDLTNCEAALARCLSDAARGVKEAQEVLSHCYSERRISRETAQSSVKRLLAADAQLDAATAAEATTRTTVEREANEAHNPDTRSRCEARALRLML